MVFEGVSFDQAARQSSFGVPAMRSALQRSHVLAYLRHQREVLRQSICAGNPNRLREIRDQDDNRAAAVRAVLALEGMSEPVYRHGGAASIPGCVVVVAPAGYEAKHVTLDAGSDVGSAGPADDT